MSIYQRTTASIFCLAVLLTASDAQAWEIKNTSQGGAIRWPDGTVQIDLSMEAEAYGISSKTGENSVESAFLTWSEEVSERLQLQFVKSETSLAPGRDGRSVVLWATHPGDFVDPEALATTYLTYTTSTGEITEADIVINAVDYEWTVVGNEFLPCHDRYDLQNILAHETGHFFGLSHSKDHRESTMFPSAGQCETSKRGLAEDDKAGMVFLYEDMQLDTEEELSISALANCSTGGTTGFFAGLFVLWAFLRPRKRSKIAGRKRRVGGSSLVVKIGILVLFVLALSETKAAATTLRYLQPSELAARADLIVQGRVVAQEVKLVNHWPVTISTVAVQACTSLPCPLTTEVWQWGGEVGNVGLIVSGVSPLVLGEEFVLFLRKNQGGHAPVGMSQGVFHVRKSGGDVLLHRDLELANFVGLPRGPLLALPKQALTAVFGVRLQMRRAK